MITFDSVTFRYQDAAGPALNDVTLTIPEGELCLVVGPTGSGKSTLLKLVNGLAPHFTGGNLSGTVTVGGLDTRTHKPRDLASTVGVVGQDPLAGFVTDRVADELAYCMEQLGIPASTMRQRVEEIIDLLGLDHLRHRAPSELSAGEQQRVAIGSALTAQPRVLVLDEPTSALDPGAAEEVLAALLRLVHDLGVTVLLAEHRLERVIQYADSIVLLGDRETSGYRPTVDGATVDAATIDAAVDDRTPGDAAVDPATIDAAADDRTPGDAAAGEAAPGLASTRFGTPAEIMRHSSIAPPIIELGRVAGWSPLPLSIRDARRVAGPLRDRLKSMSPKTPEYADTGIELVRAKKLSVHYGPRVAVARVDLTLRSGEITALMGRNGSGKSSLLWALQGSGPRSGGTVSVAGNPTAAGAGNGAVAGNDAGRVSGIDTATLAADVAIRHIVLVPQEPSDLLYLDSVAAECAEADRTAGATMGTTSALLERLAPGIPGIAHPRDLSEGQRLALVLAIQLAADPSVILLDEPTRGLDYSAKRRLATVLEERARSGAAVLLSSHDVEFVARVAHRAIMLSEGEIITDGPASHVLTASASFAPQVSRILRPLEFLTVDAVRGALRVRV